METLSQNPKLPPIIFYDGDCGLCHKSVQRVLELDREAYFSFAPLQSELAEKVLAECGKEVQLDTIFVVENTEASSKSNAVIKILEVTPYWFLGKVLKLIPRVIRDAGYDLIARKRHKFPSSECRILTEAERARFLGESNSF